MATLDDILQETAQTDSCGAKLSFVESMISQFKAIGNAYIKIAKKPRLICVGLYEVAKDICYEFPKSLVKGTKDMSLEQKLQLRASQALAISEIIGIPGTYLGMSMFKSFGADDYTAAVVGGIIGNYVTAVLGYWIPYIASTMNYEGYSAKQGLKDCYKISRDLFPAAAALYVENAPFVAGLMYLGVPYKTAVGIRLALGMAIFTGLAKQFAKDEIKAKAI